jgi:uncharacterized RDD family membrane protein YckC
MPWLLCRRVTAYFVDIVLLFLVLAPVGQLVRFVINWPVLPCSGQEIWLASALNFSLPTWIYFVLADSLARGGTIGKRLVSLKVVRSVGGRVGMARSMARNAVKLLPWETAHVSAFALSGDSANLELMQMIGLTIANGLAVLYFVVAACTRGRRSVHDYVAATEVCLAESGKVRWSQFSMPEGKSHFLREKHKELPECDSN